MVLIKAKATAEKEGDPDLRVEFEWPLPSTVKEAIDLVGEETVIDYFNAKATINLQNIARNLLSEGSSPDEVKSYMSTYKLGQTAERTRDPMKAALRAMSNMTPEQLTQMLQKAREKMEGLPGTGGGASVEQAQSQASSVTKPSATPKPKTSAVAA